MARRSVGTGGDTHPTPMPIASSAVRRYHQEGVENAEAYLHRTLSRSAYWGPGGPPQAQGWANAIRACFDNYVTMAANDNRPSLGMTLARDVEAGSHLIGVSVDVVLLDPSGYVARYVLWDVPAPDGSEAGILAAPIVRALLDELGEDRVAGCEVWHLRSGASVFVSTEEAESRFDEAVGILDRYLSDQP